MPRRRSRVENLDPQARTKIRSARPQIEVVEERVLLATFTVTSTFDNGDNLNPTPGSLRQAILTANSPNFPGLDLINFSISNTIGGGVRTIAPPAPLPPITDPVVIDGYTQPGSARNTLAVGSNAVLQVELNGAGAGPGAGLTIVGGGSTVQGLAINRFNGPGILLSSGGGNRIVGNVIGTNAAGTAALANLGDGVAIVNSPGNVIGGTAPADRNVISGNGGVFQAPVNYSAGSGPVAVAAGDFNRDSRIDLVRVNPSISAIGILLGDPNGSGTFVPGATITGVARPNDVVVGDFTGDGISDLLVADNSTTTSVFLFRGNGDGTFQQPGVAIPNSGAVSTFIAVGDLNNDVIADLVVVNSPFAPSQIPGDVRVLFGNGNGTFRAPVILATGPSFAGVAVGTFGFDPTTFDAINGVVVSDSAANTVRVFLSNNDGTFQPALPLAVGTSPAGVAVDDLTNDGRGDIVVANAGSNTISLLIQNAAGGTFQPARNLAAG
ncbi:MAG TPA: VCBS repeat-containing protein, partial [Isosphaeraceae bacterium]